MIVVGATLGRSTVMRREAARACCRVIGSVQEMAADTTTRLVVGTPSSEAASEGAPAVTKRRGWRHDAERRGSQSLHCDERRR